MTDFFNKGFILGEKRQGWIDYDRGISIILVSYRHCYEGILKSGVNMASHPWLEYINVFFFGFRMPLFFIASGMFLSGSIRKRGINPYLSNRFKTILYPMLVWGIIQVTLQLAFSGYTNSAADITARSYLDLLLNPRSTGQFWYLNALFLVGVVYALLRTFLRLSVQHQLILGLVIYFLCWYDHHVAFTYEHKLGFINDFLKYYLFFAIGDFISGFMLSERAQVVFTSRKLILPLLAAFLIIQWFFTEINLREGSNYHVENKMPLFFLAVALIGCALSMAVSFSLKKRGALPFLRVIGYHSVHIYCMQIIVMSVFRLIFMRFVHIENPTILMALVLLAGVFVPIFIYQLCLRLNLWALFSLKKPEDEISYLRKVT